MRPSHWVAFREQPEQRCLSGLLKMVKFVTYYFRRYFIVLSALFYEGIFKLRVLCDVFKLVLTSFCIPLWCFIAIPK